LPCRLIAGFQTSTEACPANSSSTFPLRHRELALETLEQSTDHHDSFRGTLGKCPSTASSRSCVPAPSTHTRSLLGASRLSSSTRPEVRPARALNRSWSEPCHGRRPVSLGAPSIGATQHYVALCAGAVIRRAVVCPDWKPKLIAPPHVFEGSISDLLDQVVAPAFPSADVLVAWTEAILAYFSGPDPICIVRGPRKGALRNERETRVVDSDNAPGIWTYLRACDLAFKPTDLGATLAAGGVPVLKMLKSKDKRDWEWNYATRALLPNDSARLWGRHLKLCHILPVQEKGLSPRQRAMRNIAPINHFVFPNGLKHFVMERVGWDEDPAPRDLGESGRIIGWVQQRLVEHLEPAGSKVYDQFLRAAGGDRPTAPILDGHIRFCLKTPAHATAATTPAVTEGFRQQRVTLGSGVSRTWTMNADLNCYVKTGETQVLINLLLNYRTSDGRIETVGRFVLDLVDLANRGIVTRRGQSFDLKLQRESGRFWIGTRKATRLPLEKFLG
jgi:hypothetical protein